jgi:hypothetical protein
MRILGRIIVEIQNRLKEKSIPLVVVLVPTVEDADLLERRFHGVQRTMEGAGVPVINALDTFRPVRILDNYRVSDFNLHPNQAGHRMIFDTLYAGLRQRAAIWSLIGGDR